MTDYPDWQAYGNAQSDNILAGVIQTLAPGFHPGPVIPALSWSSLTLLVSPSAGAARITVNHFADAAATQQLDSDTWPVSATTNLRVRAPLRGKYLRIDVNVTSAGSLTAATWANFLSSSSDRISFPVSQQNVSAFSRSLPANGVDKYTVGSICAGQAQFFYNPHDTAGKNIVVIHAADELGNSGQLIAFFNQPTAFLNQLVMIPDTIVQVEIDNTDGTTAHAYDFGLTIPPQ